MPRHHEDFISSFVDYSSFGEAPSHVYWWVGAASVAGALRRKCYIDQYYFKWFPNIYLVLVAPPGVISKTTTANIGMKLLKQIPEIHFGPNVVTWPALVKHLSTCTEEFEADGQTQVMSPLIISSSELGNLLNPQDKDMVDMLVTLWDGEDVHKMTKGNGTDVVPNPILNIVGCTTPSWIASSIPEYMLGGGLLSRCVFVFADAKERYNAYPGLHIPKDMTARAELLVEDLQDITNMSGEFSMTRKAVEWGEEWYKNLEQELASADRRLKDFIARKQVHIHKLAMIISASRSSDMVITENDLALALEKINELQLRMHEVFDSIGRSSDAVQADVLIDTILGQKKMTMEEAYRLVHSHYPKDTDFSAVLGGAIKAGYLAYATEEGVQIIVPGPAFVPKTPA